MTIDLAKTNGSSPPIKAWFDGAYQPGGRAVWGVVVEANGQTVIRKFGYVGCGSKMSSNVAEYGGCIAALQELQKYRGNAVVYGDSQLVIQQLRGAWRVKKGGLYLPYLQRAKALLQRFGREHLKLEWIPSEQNRQAHNLSRQALLRKDLKPGDQKYLLWADLANEVTLDHQRWRDQASDQKQEQPASVNSDSPRTEAILSEEKEVYADEL